MKKTIGVVAEGPRDFDMIVSLIDSITGEENEYQHLQPEPNAIGELGNGWKGVWKWYENHRAYLRDYFYSVTPHLDLLIIHMDADVVRCEKEIHCWCGKVDCAEREETHPLTCSLIADRHCPVNLPCPNHGDSPQDWIEFLREFIDSLLGEHEDLPICFMTPCDSTDTWIVSAYDGCLNAECVQDPWTSVICRAPSYHDVRLRNRPNKHKATYQKLIDGVVNSWEKVCEDCSQAQHFDDDVRHFLMTMQEMPNQAE